MQTIELTSNQAAVHYAALEKAFELLRRRAARKLLDDCELASYKEELARLSTAFPVLKNGAA